MGSVEKDESGIDLKFTSRKYNLGIDMGEGEGILDPEIQIPEESDFYEPEPLNQVVDEQFYCKLILKLQKGNNFYVIPIMIQFVMLQLCHFPNQAQGDSRKFKYSNFTQKLILNTLFNTITKCYGFLTKNTKY